MNIITKFKEFWKLKEKPFIMKEEWKLQCALCNRIRQPEEINNLYINYWLNDNGITKCPECRKAEQAKQPHCKSCICHNKDL